MGYKEEMAGLKLLKDIKLIADKEKGMKIKVSKELRYELRQIYKKWAQPVMHALIAFCIACVCVFFFNSSLGISLEMFQLEHFFAIRGPIPPPNHTIIVRIDDKSYKDLDASSKQPIPRIYVAQALQKIVSYRPKIVILDGKITKEPTVDPASDQLLERTLYDGPTVIWSGEISSDFAQEGEENIPSEERFRKAAKLELPMSIYGTQGIYGDIAKKSRTAKTLFERQPMAKALVNLGNFKIETPGSRDFINFYGPKGTIPGISLSDVIKGESKEVTSQIKDKIVLIGYQSRYLGRGTAMKDQFRVPVSADEIFGVEIHATVINNLIDSSWIKRSHPNKESVLVLLLVFIFSSYVIRTPRPLTIVVVTVMNILILLSAYIAFALYDYWIAGVPTLMLSSLLVAIGSSAYFLTRTEKYQKYLDRTFDFERDKEI